jgi:hypothetical protein
MADSKLSRIEQLVNLFDQREQAHRSFNEQIMTMLGETTLPALIELLESTQDDIQWEEVRIVEQVLLVVFTIGYNPQTNKSPILKQMSETRGDTVPVYVEQMLHLSLPLARAFDSKDDIKQFLTKAFVETTEPSPVTQPATQESASLSKEQIQQMLFFQQQTRDKMQ